MNILITAMYPVGGIRTYFDYTYSDDTKFNHNFELVCPSENTSFFENVFKQRLSAMHTDASSKFRFCAQVLKSLLKFKPDIIQSHGLTAGLLVSPLAFIFNTKHIVTLHDVFSDHHFKGWKGKLKWHILNVFLRLPSVINPCGFDTEKNLIQYFPTLNKNKIRTIQNGISVDKFNIETRRNLKQELELPENTILLGFLGRFMKQKGFDLLIEAIVKLNNNNIKVACFGWGGFIREEQEKIKKLGLSDTFLFQPHTDQVAHSIRGLDVLIIPSRWEACPLLPMEALISGVPFVGSNCIGLKEVMAGTPGLQFESENIEQLVAKIIEATENLEPLTKSTEDYRSTAIDRFSSENLKVELARLYSSLFK